MEHSKRMIVILIVVICALMAWLWLGGRKPPYLPEEQIILKAADDHERSYPTTQGLVYMGDLLKKWTNGRITVQVYHSAQLGSERETIEQTRLGAIDINRVNVNPLTQVVPAFKVLSMPYLFTDKRHMHGVLDGEIGKELLDTLIDFDLIGLGYYDSGQRSFYNSVRPVRVPADMEGLDIRVQKAEIMRDMVRSVGANPVMMAFEEVYTGLQTGVIHGAENNYPSWITKGHFEVAKYYSPNAHVRSPEVILFSRKTWDRLGEEDRRLIRRAAAQSIPHQRELWELKVEESIRKAKDAGCVIVDEVDVQAFREATEPVYELHASEFSGLIERIRRESGMANDTHSDRKAD